MRKLSLAAILLTCLLSCTREAHNNEEAVLPSSIRKVMEENNCICGPYINLYGWRGQKIYVWAAKGPLCDWTPLYYNEKGEKITMPDGYTLDLFRGESLLIKAVWTCEEQIAPGG